MHEPVNLLTREVREHAVVRYTGNYLRVYFGGIPIGGRLPIVGKRCRPLTHDFYIEEYERVGGRTYRDKVCRKCPERILLKD